MVGRLREAPWYRWRDTPHWTHGALPEGRWRCWHAEGHNVWESQVTSLQWFEREKPEENGYALSNQCPYIGRNWPYNVCGYGVQLVPSRNNFVEQANPIINYYLCLVSFQAFRFGFHSSNRAQTHVYNTISMAGLATIHVTCGCNADAIVQGKQKSPTMSSKAQTPATVPYAEPPWACGLPSPYIRDLQKAMREWVATVSKETDQSRASIQRLGRPANKNL